MLFEWKGSVLPQLLPRLILLFSFAILIVYFKTFLISNHLLLNPAIFTLFGIALAIFLGFRNSVSYDRFWEARKLWGALLNDSRSLARQSYNLIDGNDYALERNVFINLLIAFVYSLKHQLRFTNSKEDMDLLLSKEFAIILQEIQFKPILILRELGAWVKKAKIDGRIDSVTKLAFEENMNKLSDVVGGCERIASTPIPYTLQCPFASYGLYLLFYFTFWLCRDLGWLTPFIIVFIAYTFVALEAIADELEDPFGKQPNDLALDAMWSGAYRKREN